MRLREIYIECFKNLRSFKIRFDAASPYTVLVGQNGSGKSNLIEALVYLFSNLDVGEPAPFGYRLTYEHSNKTSLGGFDTVVIEASGGSHPKFGVNGHSVSRKAFMKETPEDFSPYLPRFVFAYYSGPSDRLRSYFRVSQERFYRLLKKPGVISSELPHRRLFLAENVHSQFVLLAFYGHPDNPGRAFLREHLSILDLEFVRFVINRPAWATRPTSDRFWDTTGVPRDMLELLDRLSVATTKTQRKIPISFRREKTLECWNFMLDRDGFQQMAASYESPQDLFKALESTHISDLLFELMVDVKVEDVDGSVSHRELSEGEQQLLLVLGLLRFTKQDEAIFLLDEPDTHLNPAWSVQFLRFIEDIVGEQPSSHIIMATHDPLVFAGLKKEQVRIMNWNERGELVAVPPEEEPRGMGFDAILTSDLFGLRAALDLPTLDVLDERRQLAMKADKTEPEEARLIELNRYLETLGFSLDKSDPVFTEFAEAMTQWQMQNHLIKPVLNDSERSAQRSAALTIINRLKGQK